MNGEIFIVSNYTQLRLMSRRWGGGDWIDLLSYYTIWIDKNWTRLVNLPHDDQMKFSQTWLKNNSKWSNSEYNKMRAVNNLSSMTDNDNSDINLEPLQVDYEPGYDDMIELRSETLPEDIKIWLFDLSQNFGEKDVERLVKMRAIYLELQTHERVLWDLYFTQMMTMRDISSKLKLPLTSIHLMIGELKTKFKEIV
jgi:hypothetical protein